MKEVTEWVHGVKNDDKVSEGAAKFEAAAVEAGQDHSQPTKEDAKKLKAAKEE